MEKLKQRARIKPAYDAVTNLAGFDKTIRGLRQLEDVQRAAEQWARAQENAELLRNLREGPWVSMGLLKAALVEDVRRARTRTAVRAPAESS
ncbi:MAG: hypothetical protein JRG89_10370 [Deltaproteobacteria bacterium]|nr:hypothetical protein [Deltaproteobacteria bacterium]MBW2388828.1 hypothetical protein [Deltaproteobacteria bacterium]MBW2696337.1 hypothetical protein [Deltaproteobacteria bacterium]